MRKHVLPVSILLGICGLAIFIFSPAISKPIPPGVDAGVYLSDARWILEHHSAPKIYQATYHGSRTYPAPLTAVNLAIAEFISGLDLTFPIFSAYQIFLIVLLIVSSYLVGLIYGPRVAWLYPLSLLGSYAIIRLFIGSTVSNLLAFSYMNVAFYLVHRYRQRFESSVAALLVLFLSGLYLTHNYLTAPIFLPMFIVYIGYLLLIDRQFRAGCVGRLRALNKKILITSAIAGFAALTYLVIVYIPVFQEAKYTFWNNVATSKFQVPIPISQYQNYLGPFLSSLGVIGLALYVIRFRENILTYRVFPIFWIVALVLLLQLYHLGIVFYYERLLFLGGPAIALFAAYAVNSFLDVRSGRAPLGAVTVGLFVILIASSGLGRVTALYKASNRVSRSQIEALNLLRTSTRLGEQIYSHVSGASQTGHDVMVSDRDILHLSTVFERCDLIDTVCRAFNKPGLQESQAFFRAQGVRYFLFLKPSFDGNELLDRLVTKYRSAKFQEVYAGPDVWLFRLPT